MTPQNVAQLEGTLYQKARDRAAYAYQLQSILQRANSAVTQTSASTSASQPLNIQLQSGDRPAFNCSKEKSMLSNLPRVLFLSTLREP
ncbi:hypothetical protein M427DRAFT_55690 [Gonapodya prolifera JEL478]|uniref:Uncharacterized protein n=1 Tax=Gonapodya prolifera (strain JEL478) TaxID=1344416 RepID=A0A139AHP8_GONPJ|nr:hypothetical protein M427DRAFT_55690 [Gonapodya prolifera JEL478]|eukprot:KXS16258.1 hypothetical protein M427DRAFT_55690 [Gonapodya prolifera JEL478]